MAVCRICLAEIVKVGRDSRLGVISSPSGYKAKYCYIARKF